MHSLRMSAPHGDDGVPVDDAESGPFAPAPTGPWGPPENEVPVLVAGPALLSRTDDFALILWSARGYRHGVWISVRLALRRPQGAGARDPLFEAWQRLLVGVELSDGRRAVADGGFPLAAPDEPEPRLVSWGGGGGDRSFTTTYWLTPLPPEGDLTLVSASPQLGLPESRHVIAGAALQRISSGAVELWPWEPDPVLDVDPDDMPLLPPGGWFAETLDAPEP